MRNRSLSKGDDDGVSWQTAGNKCSLIGGSDSKAEQQEEQSVLRDVSSFTCSFNSCHPTRPRSSDTTTLRMTNIKLQKTSIKARTKSF